MNKAVIFDFDGTLIDTEILWFEICRDLFESQGFKLDLETYLPCVGASLATYDPYKDLAQRIGKAELRASFLNEALRLYEERVLKLEARSGMKELLAELYAQGLSLGIASSSSSKTVLAELERLNLKALFSAFSCSDLVQEVKPAPDLYLLCMKQLGVSPDQTLAVEDSPQGVKAALAAGVKVFAVPHQLTEAMDFDPGLAWKGSVNGLYAQIQDWLRSV